MPLCHTSAPRNRISSQRSSWELDYILSQPIVPTMMQAARHTALTLRSVNTSLQATTGAACQRLYHKNVSTYHRNALPTSSCSACISTFTSSWASREQAYLCVALFAYTRQETKWLISLRWTAFGSMINVALTQVVDHYEKPRNVGSFDKTDPAVGTGLVGAPACGDVMKLQIKVRYAYLSRCT